MKPPLTRSEWKGRVAAIDACINLMRGKWSGLKEEISEGLKLAVRLEREKMRIEYQLNQQQTREVVKVYGRARTY